MIKIKKLNFYLWLLLFLFSIGLLFVSLIVAATRFNNKNKFEELENKVLQIQKMLGKFIDNLGD